MNKLLYFSAEWCHPCKIFGPRLEQITSEHNIPLEKVNVDLDTMKTKFYNIKSVPSVVLVNDNGDKLNIFMGPKDSQFILNFYKN